MNNKRKRLILLAYIVISSTSSFNIYAEDLEDNVTQQQQQPIVETTPNEGASNGTGGGADIKGSTLKLADDLSNSGNTFIGAMDNVFKDMSSADDGKVFNQVSKTMAKPVAVVSQVMRAAFIGIIMMTTLPDLIVILIPGLKGLFSGGKRNGGGMGETSGGRGGWLTADYHAVAEGGTGGGMGDGGSGKKGHVLIEYTKRRTTTLVAAVVAMLLLLTPFGYAGIVYVVRVVLAGIVYLLKMVVGVV